MERTIRHSKKRVAILNALQSTTCHPSAEWIYQTLKSTHPDLSLGTVYRNLRFFQEQNTIISVGVVNGQERFDACIEPHSHFVCQHCSAVIDVATRDGDQALNDTVSAQYGFMVDRHELTFFGTCANCQQN